MMRCLMGDTSVNPARINRSPTLFILFLSLAAPRRDTYHFDTSSFCDFPSTLLLSTIVSTHLNQMFYHLIRQFLKLLKNSLLHVFMFKESITHTCVTLTFIKRNCQVRIPSIYQYSHIQNLPS